MPDDLILLDPWPRRAEQLFDGDQRRRLHHLGSVVVCDSRSDPNGFERLLPQAAVILGQPDLPSERLLRAGALRAIVNVEGNFFPNIDYASCFARGVVVLSIAPAFAVPVAELALGLAIDLARGITLADADMRAGSELYGSKGGDGAMLLSRATVGLIGYGAIGRALRQMLSGFRTRILVYDPWLPDAVMRDDGCEPCSLDALLTSCEFVFVCAAATSENQHLLGYAELERMRPGAALVLVSRADVVDFDALIKLADVRRLRIAVDVFPEEPVPAADPVRASRLLLSPHRAGGVGQAMATAAEMILDDLSLIMKGLPPVRLQQARPQTIGRIRSKPASYR